MFGSDEGGVGHESQEEVSSIEDSGSVGDGFIEELLGEEEGEVVISDEGFGSVCGRFIEELLEIKEGGVGVTSEESFCSSGGGGFIEGLFGVEEGGGGWSIESGPVEELPVEYGCGGVVELVGFKGGSLALLLEAELSWFCEVDSNDDVGFRGAS